MKDLNELTEAVIGAAMEVHRTLGPGLLESTYEMCICRELVIREIPFERQVPIPVEYKGIKLDCGYRADIIVDSRIPSVRGRPDLMICSAISASSAVNDCRDVVQ